MAEELNSNSFFSMVTGNRENGNDDNDIKSPAHNDTNNMTEDDSVIDDSVIDDSVIDDSAIDDATLAGPNESAMPHDARRVLVHLMRQGSVMASQKSKLFELLCRHEAAIRKHLSEVYLQLVLDQKSGVAFIASMDSEHAEDADRDEQETEDATTLISKRTLSLYDTLILLVLRKHYQDRESAGEQKITIDIERLESYLTPFLPITDHASKDRKKLLARVKEMVKRKILSTIRGVEDRYEITPIIRYVVSASFLESMLEEYRALAATQVESGPTEGGDYV
ncbi:DUF4194 domain-containing protein [Alkalimarinus coralli]|uniref:DUF4194 domain-containing protein n=1 Tax=Alkalimarinus coralli TaxID=2935863 RepID=UPI00202B2BAB|nr:DUF4194 domain-containing protein [Alkalimarinus coralli]